MRSLAVLTCGLAALTLAACQKPVAPVTSDDMSLGNPKSKVTVIEYASLACPVCAQWNNETFPAFKAKYIDTGKVHYVAREALVHDPALAAAGFLTARCAGKDKYFQVTDAVYRAQGEMESGGQPLPILQGIAKDAGLSDSQFEACIKDPKALAAIQSRWDKYVKDEKINATPTFVINGTTLTGNQPMAALDAAIAAAETKAAGS